MTETNDFFVVLVMMHLFTILVHHVGCFLEGDGKLAHVFGAHHDLDELMKAPEHTVLGVRNAVFLAYDFNQRLGLAIGKHGKRGP